MTHICKIPIVCMFQKVSVSRGRSYIHENFFSSYQKKNSLLCGVSCSVPVFFQDIRIVENSFSSKKNIKMKKKTKQNKTGEKKTGFPPFSFVERKKSRLHL